MAVGKATMQRKNINFDPESIVVLFVVTLAKLLPIINPEINGKLGLGVNYLLKDFLYQVTVHILF